MVGISAVVALSTNEVGGDDKPLVAEELGFGEGTDGTEDGTLKATSSRPSFFTAVVAESLIPPIFDLF